MLNHRIYSVKYTQKPYKYNITEFYQKIYNNDDNRKRILRKLIFPNFDLLKHDPKYKEAYVNDYRKLYYDDKILNFKSEYHAFYPENFYYFWEILNTFPIITGTTKTFVFYDGKKNHLPLGHLESVFRFCEDNFIYENNEYYHIVSDKKHELKDKRFAIINKNFKSHTQLNKNITFDCFINMSCEININMIMNSNLGGSMIIYLEDLFATDNDNVLEQLIGYYEQVYIYQPTLQDPLVTSGYLILLNFQKVSNKKQNTNLISIRNDYYINYLDKLLELDNYLINEDSQDVPNNDKLTEWMHKYKLITQPDNYTNELSYFKYRINITDENKNRIDINKIHSTKLHENKRNLNKYKRIIDTKEQFVNNDLEHDIIDWNKLTDCIDLYKNLKKLITWKFNAEAVNNVWLKFYELLVQENIINKDIKTIKTFHIYETTGSSIFAFNHYLATHTNAEFFEWYAQCPNKHDFKGRYNLLDIYPNNWILSNDINNMKRDPRLQNLDIIICDPGMRIPSDKFNEQESHIGLLILEKLYTSLQLLPLHKTLIIKMFLPLAEKLSLEMLYLLTQCFGNVDVIKPLSSHASSSEIYCVCYDYNKQISPEINNIIEQILTHQNINFHIFDSLPENFVNQIIHISNILTNKQIESIKRSLYLRHHYYYNYDLQNELSIIKEDKCNQWIELNKMKSIYDKYKIIC